MLLLCGAAWAGAPKLDDPLAVRGAVRHVRVENGTAEFNGEDWLHPQRLGRTFAFATFRRDGKPLELVTLMLPKDPKAPRESMSERYAYNAFGSETLYLREASGALISRRDTHYTRKGIIYAKDEISPAPDNPNPHAYRRTSFSYDALGRELSSWFYNADGVLENGESVHYNAQGEEAGEKVYGRNNVLVGEQRSTFDAEGRELTRIVMNGQGDELDYYTYHYDTQGRLVECLEYKPRPKVITRWVTTYTDKGRIHEQFALDNGDTPKPVHTVLYDAADRMLGERGWNYNKYTGKLSSRWETNYDAQGRLVDDAQFLPPNPTPYTKKVYTYNAHGDIERLTEYSWNYTSRDSKWYYVYDRQGNWTARFTYIYKRGDPVQGLHPGEASFRTLTYWSDRWSWVPVWKDALFIHPEYHRWIWIGGFGSLALLCLLGWGVRRWRARRRAAAIAEEKEVEVAEGEDRQQEAEEVES